MNGLMQDWPLTCGRIIEHAARQHGQRRIVTRCADGSLQVTNYRQIHARALRISKRLAAEGIQAGDRIATLASSTASHFECWYGIAAMGAIYHPVNPRLFAEQITYIINHARDRIMFLDASFIGLAESLANGLPSIERYVVFTDQGKLPPTTLRNAIAYEDWLAEADGDFSWPALEENTAASLTYTSGTTGQPKGVLYSHRSIALLGLIANSPDMYGFGANDVVLQLVPMCHANGWTWPFAAPIAGASLIFPGARLDGASIAELLIDEQVTCTGGVPTVWQGVLDHLAERKQVLTELKRVYIGGSPCSRSMLDAFAVHRQVDVRSGYGMTEMGPLGSVYSPLPETKDFSGEEVIKLRQSQGRPPFLVEYELRNEQGERLPWDGKQVGNLKARGPGIVKNYYQSGKDTELDENGFFDTGDIATIDPNGYVHLTDRAKDLVKSGGEWISSIDLENHVMRHPDVFEAAVIAARHPKWVERPLLVVVLREGRSTPGQEILDFLKDKVASWCVPDDVVFVDALPHTATGKLHKSVLRKQFEDYRLPGL